MADRIIQLALDAENKQIIAQVLDPADGSVVSAWGSIKLTLGKDPGTTPTQPGTNMGLEIKLRETQGCDPDTGDPVYFMCLRSEYYDTPKTSNPEV